MKNIDKFKWILKKNCTHFCIRIMTREFLRAKPEGTPEGKGVYLTVYSKSSPNTDSI